MARSSRTWRFSLARIAMVAAGAAGLLGVGCAAAGPGAERGMAMADRVDSETEVHAVLDDFHAAAAAADGARYFAHFAPDGVFVGTDATERWDVAAFRAYAAPHFEAGRGWAYRSVERHVRVATGDAVAWFDERLRNDAYGDVRGSGVLRRIDGAWRIEQYVLSFPIPNDVAREVVERIRLHGGERP